MRSVIISIIILALTVSAVTLNSVCAQSKLNNILDLIELTENKDDINNLSVNWNKVKKFLSLTTHRRELDEITHSINDIGIAFNNNDNFAFDEAKSSARELIKEILSSQRFDLRSVI